MNSYRLFLAILLVISFSVCASQSFAGVEEKTRSIEEIAEAVIPCVVVVRTDKGSGTGFFVTYDGKVMTNFHVVEGAQKIEVQNHQGEIFPVKKILARDEKNDLALLLVDIPKTKVHSLTLNPFLPRKGTAIVVVGNPLNFAFSVYCGYVANIVDIPPLKDLIQLDVTAYPGSSGSPVVNLRGEVIGIVKGRYQGWERINFAIPAQKALQLDYEVSVETGDRLASRGKYAEAIEAYTGAINCGSRPFKALYGRARAYYNLGQWKEALQDLTRALEFEPRLPQIYYARGLCFLRLGDCSSARKEHASLASLDASLAQQLLNLIRGRCR